MSIKKKALVRGAAILFSRAHAFGIRLVSVCMERSQ